MAECYSITAIYENMDGFWEYHGKQNKWHRKTQEPYDFTHMWDIKLKETSEQTGKTSKHKLIGIDTSVLVSRGKGHEGGSKEYRGQIHGEGGRVGFGWAAHSAVYRWCIIELYTWNPYNLINQCHPNKFNFKKERLN